MYRAIRRALFAVDPERAHELATSVLSMAQGSSFLQRQLSPGESPSPRLTTSALGIQFPGAIGLAAGFDKHATCYNALLALGFSHVEVGTITPRPQVGNPKPRIWRFPGHQALVNRLGFNNPGVEAARARLERHPSRGVIGVNVGRNKDTAPEAHLEDYASAAAELAPYGAYVTVNVSSPNTPGLRNLQAPEAAATLVEGVLEALDDAGATRPVLLKLHPDAEPGQLAKVATAAVDAGAAGIIAVNTTTHRPAGLEDAPGGGLSGPALTDRATEITRHLYRAVGDEVPIVGVGGIADGEDAIERIRAGATLLQAYTAFVYRGPRFPALMQHEMLAEMDARGVDHVRELVGEDA